MLPWRGQFISLVQVCWSPSAEHKELKPTKKRTRGNVNNANVASDDVRVDDGQGTHDTQTKDNEDKTQQTSTNDETKGYVINTGALSCRNDPQKTVKDRQRPSNKS
jgi:hypothetical protein